jgi:hypothetical protein
MTGSGGIVTELAAAESVDEGDGNGAADKGVWAEP